MSANIEPDRWSLALEDADGDGSTILAEFDTDGIMFDVSSASSINPGVLVKLNSEDCRRLADFINSLGFPS